MSKIAFYEKPYVVIGNIKQTGSKRYLRAYVKIRLLKRGKLGTYEKLNFQYQYVIEENKMCITWFYPSESGGIVAMKLQ